MVIHEENSRQVSFSVLAIHILVSNLIRSRASRHFVRNWHVFL